MREALWLDVNVLNICNVYSMDFEKVYGKIKKEFIHVHHIKPISEINNEYIINYKEDLIPV